jgi:phosphopantetheinyl transferase
MTEGDPALILRHLHPQEISYAQREGNEGFYRIWCRKECYIKAFGWRELGTFNTLAAPPGFEYFDLSVEPTVALCVLSPIRPTMERVTNKMLMEVLEQ